MVLDESPRREHDAPAIRIDLPRDAQAPAAARAAVSGFFEGRELDAGTLASIRLLVSELVSNAVLHSDAPAGSEIAMSMRLLDTHALRVEVLDAGSGFTPGPRDPSRHEGGYGLSLVDKQASRWGVERRDGVCVWFEMGIAPAAS
jgi:anti-sigma regulatory factor (Ser/Thr protein kinase)